jgi:TPR repeat protein
LRARAEQGDARAQNGLGLRYYHGTWLRQDKVEAAQWFRKAAEQGHVKALFNLGVCHYKGEGVGADLVEAYKWFWLAERAGDKPAGTECLALAKLLTAAQVAEAQARAKLYRPKSPLSRPAKP